MTITEDTFTTPAGEVTDHDPGGVQWVGARVEADPIPDELLGECGYEEGQTHRTLAGFNELGADDAEEAVLTHPTRTGAARAIEGNDDYWSTYALVPAQVADDAPVRPRGEAWSDLLCALALVAGRPGTNPDRPLQCSHDVLTLNVDPRDYSAIELAQLDAWGFAPNDSGEAMWSRRYGSA